jgi:hypothetical protein
MIFTGQSNEESHGTSASTYGFTGIPGGVGSAGINGAASCYETTVTPSGATSGSGTLSCTATTSGAIYAGEVVTGSGVPTGQVISAEYGNGNFPGVTGAGSAGTYVVTPAATVGSSGSPVSMTFAEPDIGGSGTLNTNCQIWTPGTTSGSWQAYNPKVNTDSQGGNSQSAAFGPEGAICQHWTADNPGKTLYMIKIAIGGSHLCDVTAGSNDLSPEYAGTGISSPVYSLLQTQTIAAEAALNTQFGITNYSVNMFQYGQGEQDSQDECSYPYAPFSATSTPNEYLVNLQDIIGRFAIPTTISASFNGYITNTTLTVTSMVSGTVHQYQLLTGTGIAAKTYVGTQISGTTGGVGTYNLQVYQATAQAGESITSSSGAVCDNGSINGEFFNAVPDSHTTTTITKSCVSGGVFGVGNTLSGTNILSGTTITSLDGSGHTADGIYYVNVNQTVGSSASPIAMTASVTGWGTGSDSAKFTMFQTFGAATASGVQIAQQYVNDNLVTALKAITVNTNDALKATPAEIHYHTAWIAELGRRLYEAFLGQCDYHSPTC